MDWVDVVSGGVGGALALAGWQRWTAGDKVGAWCLAFMVLGVVLVIAKGPQ
jgi:hypothetical protein